MRILKLVLAFLFVICPISGDVLAQSTKVKYVKSKGGLKALISLGKSYNKMKRQWDAETRNYNKAKEAVLEGRLREGDTSSEIMKNVGEPVVVLSRKRAETVKWIYKPADATFFEDRKVYLIFDKDDRLTGWKVLEKETE
ncbi:MAG: hypothetical protein PVH45_00195 [Candidatus Omnitrophota bacterium]|jgi:hypothetical protein